MSMSQDNARTDGRARAAVAGAMVVCGAGALYAAAAADHVTVYVVLCSVGGCLALAGARILTRELAVVLRPWRRSAEDAMQAWMRADLLRAVQGGTARRVLRERRRERWRAFGRALDPYLSALVGLVMIWRSFYLPAELPAFWRLVCVLSGAVSLRDFWLAAVSSRMGVVK